MQHPAIAEALDKANKALLAKYGATAVLRLEAPRNMPTRRWVTLISDIAAFLSSEFAGEADALGWDELDLFGCDPDRPFARIDSAGLFLLLDGDKIIGLTDATATIETRSGARQTFRRKLGETTGRALIWELAARAKKNRTDGAGSDSDELGGPRNNPKSRYRSSNPGAGNPRPEAAQREAAERRRDRRGSVPAHRPRRGQLAPCARGVHGRAGNDRARYPALGIKGQTAADERRARERNPAWTRRRQQQRAAGRLSLR
jgi:hypothetical protein